MYIMMYISYIYIYTLYIYVVLTLLLVEACTLHPSLPAGSMLNPSDKNPFSRKKYAEKTDQLNIGNS